MRCWFFHKWSKWSAGERWGITYWRQLRRCEKCDHPLDIIRIEKAPEPVVEVNWLMWDDEFSEAYLDTEDKLSTSKHAIKLTIINGKLEKSEQVK